MVGYSLACFIMFYMPLSSISLLLVCLLRYIEVFKIISPQWFAITCCWILMGLLWWWRRSLWIWRGLSGIVCSMLRSIGLISTILCARLRLFICSGLLCIRVWLIIATRNIAWIIVGHHAQGYAVEKQILKFVSGCWLINDKYLYMGVLSAML